MEPGEIKKRLKGRLIENTPPSGETFFSVREKDLMGLADENSLELAEVMILCLKAGIWPERYRAHRGSFTTQDQIRLLESTVAVIGAGGLGGVVSLSLARTGVGRIIICDGDSFDESNLNRQALSNVERLGVPKARVASAEIEMVNPSVQVIPYPVWAAADNFPEILESARVALDCLDNLETRYLLEREAKRQGIPYVHAAVAGQEGLLMTVYPEDPGLIGLYGPTPAQKSETAEALLGVPTCTPAVLGPLQVIEALNILLGRPLMARKRLIHVDLSLPSVEISSFG